MATAESVKAKLQGLIDSANAKTGNSDTDLTTAVNALVSGYGQGGGGTGTGVYKDVDCYVVMQGVTLYVGWIFQRQKWAVPTYYVVEAFPESPVATTNPTEGIYVYIDAESSIPQLYLDFDGSGNFMWMPLSEVLESAFDVSLPFMGRTYCIEEEVDEGLYVTYVEEGNMEDEFASAKAKAEYLKSVIPSVNFTKYASLSGSEEGIELHNINNISITSIDIKLCVTSIAAAVFRGCINLASITIPPTVTSIGATAFYDCTSLTDITYTGTKEQWKAISFGSNWDSNTPDYIVTCADGTIAKDGTET